MLGKAVDSDRFDEHQTRLFVKPFAEVDVAGGNNGASAPLTVESVEPPGNSA